MRPQAGENAQKNRAVKFHHAGKRELYTRAGELQN